MGGNSSGPWVVVQVKSRRQAGNAVFIVLGGIGFLCFGFKKGKQPEVISLAEKNLFQAISFRTGSDIRTAGQAEPAQDEKVEAMLTVDKETLNSNQHFITMTTKFGTVKKTPIKEYANIRSSGKIGIALREGDSLVHAQVTDGNNYLLLVTRHGKSIKFKESEITPTGRSTYGVKGITLRQGDTIIAAETFEVNPARPADKRRKFFREILVVTEKGLGKRTDIDEYPAQKRGGQGVKVAELSDKTGLVASARLITEDDNEVVLTTKHAQVIKLPLKNIKVLGRSTQGVILMRPTKGDLITSVTTIQNGDEEESIA